MCISSLALYAFQPHASEAERVVSGTLGVMGAGAVLGKCRAIWREYHAPPLQIVEEVEDLELAAPPPTVSGSPKQMMLRGYQPV